MDKEMLRMIQRKLSLSYNCAKEVEEKIHRQYDIKLPESELGYMAIHIERLRKKD